MGTVRAEGWNTQQMVKLKPADQGLTGLSGLAA